MDVMLWKPVLFLVALVLLFGVAWNVVNPPSEPRVQAASGTVERRLHLTVESRWDTDTRRRFVCREEP